MTDHPEPRKHVRNRLWPPFSRGESEGAGDCRLLPASSIPGCNYGQPFLLTVATRGQESPNNANPPLGWTCLSWQNFHPLSLSPSLPPRSPPCPHTPPPPPRHITKKGLDMILRQLSVVFSLLPHAWRMKLHSLINGIWKGIDVCQASC